MQAFESHLLLSAFGVVGGVISEWRIIVQLIQKDVTPPYTMQQNNKAMFLVSVQRLRDSAIALNMTAATRAGRDAFDLYFERLSSRAPMSAYDLGQLVGPGERLLHAYASEAEARRFFSVDAKHTELVDDVRHFFGAQVDSAFPSAKQEIRDAARCRAFGLWTASVLHLMRALEPAIKSLAENAGAPAEQNWNRTLDQVDAKLREVKKSTHDDYEEQWASEASAHLRAIKDAWRNYAAHGRVRYNEDEAVSIYENVRSLMRTIATRLSEQP